MEARFFYLNEHTYPGMSYRTTVQSGKNVRSALHTHDYYEIMLMTAGSVEHFINGQKVINRMGELILIRPHDVHRVVINDGNSEYINMNFSENMMLSLLEFWDNDTLKKEIIESQLPPIRVLNQSDLEYARNKMLQTMFRDYVSPSEQEYVMRKKLFDLFAAFFVKEFSEVKKFGPGWLSDTMKKMENIENFRVGLSRMVELSGKSLEHLSRSLVKYYGYTPTKYINMLRINYMASMLEYSTLSIIDIWLNAGFESAAYAYKLFKERFGITPQQYRKLHI